MCPVQKCGHDKQDVLGVVIKYNEENGDESFTHYTCPKCHVKYLIPRKGNVKEQELTQEFVDASEIKLK